MNLHFYLFSDYLGVCSNIYKSILLFYARGTQEIGAFTVGKISLALYIVLHTNLILKVMSV